MKTEIELRQQAIALHLQGWNKSQIARRLQRSRPWVNRWISRYKSEAPMTSLQNHSRAPQHIRWAYPERIKRMAIQIRIRMRFSVRSRPSKKAISPSACRCTGPR